MSDLQAAAKQTQLNQISLIIQKYLPLIKSLQTGLLLVTGLAGFTSVKCPITHWTTVLSLAGSLFLAISGSTVLNMWYDRDIDGRMERTKKRPIPSGSVAPWEAFRLGMTLSISGLVWALVLNPLYALVVFAGLFFDVVVYTIWLKRRRAWSIIWGGISGGMPVLAGRVLAIGYIDWIGILLAVSVLFWIPTHIMTFNLRHFEDYKHAKVPTFAEVYGFQMTRKIIAISSVLAAAAMVTASYGIGLSIGCLRIVAILSLGLLFLAVRSAVKPSDMWNFRLFKYASIYMLGAMLLIALQSF